MEMLTAVNRIYPPEMQKNILKLLCNNMLTLFFYYYIIWDMLKYTLTYTRKNILRQNNSHLKWKGAFVYSVLGGFFWKKKSIEVLKLQR